MVSTATRKLRAGSRNVLAALAFTAARVELADENGSALGISFYGCFRFPLRELVGEGGVCYAVACRGERGVTREEVVVN